MTSASGGPGWWQASDLKWYPPQRHPHYGATLPPPPSPASPPPQPRGRAAAPVSSGGPGRLSEADRIRILDAALEPSIRGGRMQNAEGVWVRSGPRVTRFSGTSAEVWLTSRATHPARILFYLLMSFVSCGIYVPVWFISTLLRPKNYMVTVDEYGNVSWRREKIKPLQRVLSVVVVFLGIWWIGTVIIYWKAHGF